ncbi:MAG: DNA translocase FtsK 4TM domain-containing protein [Bacteroidetes bacterium]|nr:DNA translocase FtsK 4TM domain-containing protein [Bacteroidota bacterium]
MADNQRREENTGKPEHRRQIIAIVGILLSLMLLLSLLSYTSEDQTNGDVALTDLWKVFVNDAAIMTKAERTENWLGLLGAIVANFFINTTIGYAIVVLPFLGVLWSLYVLNRKHLRKKITVTNYTLLLAILFAAFTGVLKQFDEGLPLEWSGVVGHFIAHILTASIGKTGAVLVVGAAFVMVVTLLVEPVRPRVQPQRVPPPPPPEKPAASPTEEIDEDLPVEIQERVQEEEVDFDERSPEEEASADEEIDYVFPSVELLDAHRASEEVNEEELKANAELLRAKLADFSVEIESVAVTPGPVVTLYELVPAAGVKISRIESLQDDIALALKAKGIRIIAPMPGKGTVGVEIPNHNPSLVTIRSIINSTKFRDARAALPLAIGKTISGEVFVDDLARMPHLLIAGATGSGKSVGINTLLASLLYRLHPSDVKFVIIDPKKIELTQYQKLKNHFLAISPDLNETIITTPGNAVLALKSVEMEMDRRYDRLASAGVRNIADYNERLKDGRLHDTETVKHRKLPYLIVVVDELADLMITAAREVEEPIARLAQLARAVGIHLVLATQRPSVDVITGVIKANFPARMAFQVASKTDSRTILDMNGADQLLGNGDMLYLPSGSPKPFRIQNAFISTDEVERLTQHIGKQQGYSKPFFLPSALEKRKGAGTGVDGMRDELFEEAARTVVQYKQGSVSLLQRRLKVGYSRAARIIDELEMAGIVGGSDGSKAREVLCESEAELEHILKSLE